MKIVKSNRSFCHFFPALPKTFFMLEMISKHLLNNKKWKRSSQVDSGAFVKTIWRK